MIVRAWKRFRPVNVYEKEENTQRTQDNAEKKKDTTPRTQEKKIRNIFGKIFVNELISKIRLRLYDFQETLYQIDFKKHYKTYIRNDHEALFSEGIKEYEDGKMRAIDVEAQKREETMDKAYDDAMYGYDEQGKKYQKDDYEDDVFYREVQMVETFLENFIFSTASSRDTQIDLNLILKALPIRVDKNNYYRVEMFNFKSV